MDETGVPPENVIVIDADEFEEALNDPKVHEMWRRADEYRRALIERGHCSMCLVVNCEHLSRLPRDTPLLGAHGLR